MVMSESLEDLKEIIDNAPDGKTHALNDGGIITYWNDDDIGCLAISGDGVSLSGMRSLSDIKCIIELMEWQQSAFEDHPNIDIDMENL